VCAQARVASDLEQLGRGYATLAYPLFLEENPGGSAIPSRDSRGEVSVHVIVEEPQVASDMELVNSRDVCHTTSNALEAPIIVTYRGFFSR
jgi:hypothetical protein